MMKVGFVGLGVMGKPMALNLVKAGFDVTVWNRTKGKTIELAQAGARVAPSLPELAATCEVVVIVVNDTPDVEAVLFGESGLSKGLREGTMIVDMSTIDAAATEEFALKLTDLGCDFLDAPVSGGDVGARNATLTIMVGGKRAAFERALPIFEALGRNIVYCGKSGNGQRTKMINQVLCGLHTVALCEALALAERVGLDLETTHRVVSSGAAASWALDNYGPRILKGDLQPGFRLALQQKDLRIAREAAQEHDSKFKGIAVAYELFSKAVAERYGDLGSHGLIKLYQ